MRDNKRKWVAIWLIAGVVMIIVQTLLGGVTRLTGSGLSITEWKPIMGALPPASDQEWQKAFEGYKQIGQYKILNHDFSLSDFKAIFFWEWFHRLWARLLGVVFATGFIFFFVKKYFDRQMVVPLLVLFALGGLQGLIGWLMVSTGLNTEDVHVHYIALCVHFIAAMILACYTLWFALQLLIPEEAKIGNTTLWTGTLVLILLTFIQLAYGSFMAGSKAAISAPTWPTINGFWVPNTLATNGWLRDDNLGALQLNIQFLHRTIAYLLFAGIVIWFIAARQTHGLFRKASIWPVTLVVTQVVLGVLTVINSVHLQPNRFGIFESFAELHQLVAMFLLMALLVSFFTVRRVK